MQPTLIVREACEHNLCAVSLDLPHESLVAFSGPSGSGKTSLVLDTIYAEARRRFLAALDQGGGWRALRVPKASRIDGLAPALALAGGAGHQSPRATVATLSGLYDLLRLLFARVGRPGCLHCGGRVQTHRFEEANETAASMPAGTRLMILAPRRLREDETPEQVLAAIDRAGYRHVRLDGQDLLLEEIAPERIARAQHLSVVVDRLSRQKGHRAPLARVPASGLRGRRRPSGTFHSRRRKRSGFCGATGVLDLRRALPGPRTRVVFL